MVFRLEDGRNRFYQWDLDRRVIVLDPNITEVHFCNTTEDCSLVVKVYKDGLYNYANVPNVLLQDTWPIRVYGYDETYTKHFAIFNIVCRTKPADYVYTETEVKSWEAIVERVDEIEKTIPALVEEYLNENPIEADMSNYYTKEEVDNAIETIELTPGPQGKPGKDGKDGYTPQKGVDYFDGEDGKDYVLTEEDLVEIASLVEVPAGVTEARVNELINEALGVIENGTY